MKVVFDQKIIFNMVSEFSEKNTNMYKIIFLKYKFEIKIHFL